MSATTGSIEHAAATLKAGGVIAYPTEAVWGLGCDPHHHAACERLLTLKNRSASMGLLLVAADFEQIARYIGDAPATAIAQARASWPGAHSWVFPRSADVPAWIHGQHPGVGLRVSAHPGVVALCRAFGGALVSTSANRHGQAAARCSEEIRSMFGDELDFVLEGALGGLERPTPIRDALNGDIVRR